MEKKNINPYVDKSKSNTMETIDSIKYHLYNISKSLCHIVIVLNRPDDADLS